MHTKYLLCTLHLFYSSFFHFAFDILKKKNDIYFSGTAFQILINFVQEMPTFNLRQRCIRNFRRNHIYQNPGPTLVRRVAFTNPSWRTLFLILVLHYVSGTTFTTNPIPTFFPPIFFSPQMKSFSRFFI